MGKASKAPEVSEAEFQKAVIDAAHFNGWTVAHFRTALTASGRHITPVAADGKGFPDLVLVKAGVGVMFRELKKDSGKVAVDQQAWLNVLQGSGADADVWRPRDWPDIEAQLSQRGSTHISAIGPGNRFLARPPKGS